MQIIKQPQTLKEFVEKFLDTNGRSSIDLIAKAIHHQHRHDWSFNTGTLAKIRGEWMRKQATIQNNVVVATVNKPTALREPILGIKLENTFRREPVKLVPATQQVEEKIEEKVVMVKQESKTPALTDWEREEAKRRTRKGTELRKKYVNALLDENFKLRYTDVMSILNTEFGIGVDCTWLKETVNTALAVNGLPPRRKPRPVVKTEVKPPVAAVVQAPTPVIPVAPPLEKAMESIITQIEQLVSEYNLSSLTIEANMDEVKWTPSMSKRKSK